MPEGDMLEGLPDLTPVAIPGDIAAVVAETKVTRKKEPESIQLRKNGVLVPGTAVWCHETQVVEGVERVRISEPCEGWVNKADVALGQVVVVNSTVGATVRSGIDLKSEVVGELPYDSRAFVVEKATAPGGKLRARIIDPLEGWISVKCVLPIVDRAGEVQAAGKKVVDPSDVGDKSMVYTHYMEMDVNRIYKKLWDTGLMYGPRFRMLKRAWRTDVDAVGIVGPLKEESEGWLVHPALSDSMLHLTTVAPAPPAGGWPWAEDSKDEAAADVAVEAK
ncbi:hypothetical protein CTAYLR_002257 [Chrysophaeum taylorii]|uniref:PKS/mFAS DH domain-containing protein n=1 Tax=Chrysophaeum taylorii TaxID=2483200 RepID=A0AAD7UNQ0_9STRA|nr:hypothetical protein CTAYLR_002257 [Chrysophaeum taylorii]